MVSDLHTELGGWFLEIIFSDVSVVRTTAGCTVKQLVPAATFFYLNAVSRGHVRPGFRQSGSTSYRKYV